MKEIIKITSEILRQREKDDSDMVEVENLFKLIKNLDPDEDYKKFLANVQKDQETEKKKEGSIFVNKEDFNPNNYHFDDDEDDLEDYEVHYSI